MESSAKSKKGWLNRNIFGMGLGSLFGDWNYEMASAILPLFLSSVLGAPAFALGVIEGVADGVATLFQIFGGWYSDRIGKRKGLIVIGYVIIALSKASFAIATNWWYVLIGRTVGWAGWAVRAPARDALLLESTKPATVGRAFGFHRTMDRIGAIAGPLTATLLLAHLSIRSIFLVALIPGIFASLSIVLLVKEKVRAPNVKSTWESVRGLSPNFVKFLVPVGLFGISNFAPTLLILRAQELLSPSHGALIAGTFSVALYTFSNVVYAAVGYPIGVLADRYSKKAILSIGYLLFGALCFGFSVADGALWSLGILFAISGVYTAIIESSEPALASTLIAEDQHGTGYGVLSAVNGVGDFLSSITVGLLWTFVSPLIAFSFGGTLAIIAAILMFFVKRQI